MSLARQITVNNIIMLQELLVLYLKHKERAEQTRRVRRFCVNSVNNNRNKQGFYNNLIGEMRLTDTEAFVNYHRMSRESFDDLLSMVGPLIERVDIGERSITAEQRLALTIRYLASGDSMVSIGFYGYRVGKATASIIIRETCEALWDCLRGSVFPAPTTDMWHKISSDYDQLCNFPHCLGAMDGKHVLIQAFGNCGSVYRNSKHSHSVVLFAICDAHYKFVLVDIGAPGNVSDSNIFRRSNFGRTIICEGKDLNLPPSSNLRDSKEYPYVFVGNEAFPLLPNLMRPYPGRNTSLLPQDQSVFNYRLSRATKVSENAFGILANRWQIYRRPILARRITVFAIIKATVVLHNWLLEKNVPEYMNAGLADNYFGETCQPGTWRNEETSGMQSVQRVGTNNSSVNAKEIRYQFKKYFNEVDVLPWQNNKL